MTTTRRGLADGLIIRGWIINRYQSIRVGDTGKFKYTKVIMARMGNKGELSYAAGYLVKIVR